jgi:hypothetical protein
MKLLATITGFQITYFCSHRNFMEVSNPISGFVGCESLYRNHYCNSLFLSAIKKISFIEAKH